MGAGVGGGFPVYCSHIPMEVGCMLRGGEEERGSPPSTHSRQGRSILPGQAATGMGEAQELAGAGATRPHRGSEKQPLPRALERAPGRKLAHDTTCWRGRGGAVQPHDEATKPGPERRLRAPRPQGRRGGQKVQAAQPNSRLHLPGWGLCTQRLGSPFWAAGHGIQGPEAASWKPEPIPAEPSRPVGHF